MEASSAPAPRPPWLLFEATELEGVLHELSAPMAEPFGATVLPGVCRLRLHGCQGLRY